MTDTHNQPPKPPAPGNKTPAKPAASGKNTPLTDRIENKRVINRLIDYFEKKA